MQTALRRSLNEEQWTALVKAALQRLDEVINEGERTALYTRLTRFEKRAAQDYTDRQLAPGDDRKRVLREIFQKKNETLGIVRSVMRFVLARICKDLFGSEPFFYAKPEGRADKALSIGIQRHAGWKLGQANYREKVKRAVEDVLAVGFCPIKTTWDTQEDVSEELRIVLVDTATKKPVLTADGDFIFQEDDTIGGEAVTDEATGEPIVDPTTGQTSTTPLSFAKAPEIVMNSEQYEWSEQLVTERVKIYNGLRIDPCDRRDVFWPINVADLADADIVAHRYDCRLSELRRRYGNPKSPADDGKKSVESKDSEVDAILDRLKNESGTPKAEAGQPTQHESESSGPEWDPTIKTVEASFDYDCFGDGIVRRLHLVLLPESQECIYAEYRAALAPRAAKNIHLVAINRPRNRAYGRGFYEVYEELEDMADEFLNRIIERNEYNSKPKVAWSPHNTVEGKARPNLSFWDTETITPDNPQWQPKDIAHVFTLPDLDERTWDLMNLFMQMIQLDSGVTNASQGDTTNLPSNTTATGINSMLESSSVLHQFVLEEIRDGLTRQLGFAIGLIYLKQDADETYEYLEGSDDAQGVMALKDARQLRHLPMNVDILLTRVKRQEQREAAMAGIPLGVQFGQLPPPDQARMKDAFVQLYRALGFDDAERFFKSTDQIAIELVTALQQQGWVVQPPTQAAGAPGAPVEGESEPPAAPMEVAA